MAVFASYLYSRTNSPFLLSLPPSLPPSLSTMFSSKTSDSPDLARIVSTRHAQRLADLLKDKSFKVRPPFLPPLPPYLVL